jgi:hypothetical protein
MEELLNLLNEYEKVLNSWKERQLTKGKSRLYRNWWGYNVTDTMIISKEYGFIKWLVDTDKINISRLWKESDMWFGDKYTREESLLMLLSISNHVMRELITYLK